MIVTIISLAMSRPTSLVLGANVSVHLGFNEFVFVGLPVC